MERTALFDSRHRYRYRLGRSWDQRLPCLGWVMLNPNNADELHDDPTIRRCVAFARSWGFGSIEVVNLFGLRARQPRELRVADDPVGPENHAIASEALAPCQSVMAGWGAWGSLHGRGRHFRLTARRDLYCLGLTANGEPRHPLYLPRETVPALLHRPDCPDCRSS